MRICFLSAEYSPFAKTGGLGDVSAALTRHLARRGHDLRVFIPLHGQMDLRGVDRHPVDFLQGLSVRVGPHEFHYGVDTARVPGSDLWVHLVDCPAIFDRPRIYSDAPDEHVRYLMLTRAAFECCQRMSFAPEILHSNDWHTAFAPLLLRTAEHTLVYDSGPGDGGEANLVGSVIVPALSRAGGRAPDRIVISHGDLDHAGGLRTLARLYPAAEYRVNLKRPPAGTSPCQAGLSWRWDDVGFTVLHPSPSLPYLGNDSSCVLAVAGRGGRVLLAGDISETVERRLLAADARRYSVVLVPHHGSRTSSSPPFVAAVRADVAVATAGLGNRFGFPKAEIRQRYEAAGARFWSTGDCGALQLTLHADGRLEARSARRDRASTWRWPVGADCPGEGAAP